MRQQLRQKGMKTGARMNRAKKRPPHLTYSAFCLTARDPTRGICRLSAAAKSANSFCPVKRKRALLESNPPRDNWIQRRRNKNVSLFGEAYTSPKTNLETLFQSLSMPYKTHPNLSRRARRVFHMDSSNKKR